MDNSEKINSEIVVSEKEIYEMLDSLFEAADNKWWNDFYSNKKRDIPFFTDAPDENLYDYVRTGKITAGSVLEIGCGNGRNSRFLARNHFNVSAIDFSQEAVEWAIGQANNEHLKINFKCVSIFDISADEKSFDFIYDSGCLHHIKPHRRVQYLHTVQKLLKDDGRFGLVCFNTKGGSNISDYDAYREFSMRGGLAFTKEKIEKILNPFFEIIKLREMNDEANPNLFGKDFLWSVLMKKR